MASLRKLPYGEYADEQYLGLSTDTKPTDNVQLYALYLELDTGDFYYFDGADWAKVGG